jgi:hypothetical protein
MGLNNPIVGSDRFVTSTIADCYRLERPLAGWDYLPLGNRAFARRTDPHYLLLAGVTGALFWHFSPSTACAKDCCLFFPQPRLAQAFQMQLVHPLVAQGPKLEV